MCSPKGRSKAFIEYLLYSIKRLSLRHSLGELKFGAKAHSFVTLKRQSPQTMIIRIVLITREGVYAQKKEKLSLFNKEGRAKRREISNTNRRGEPMCSPKGRSKAFIEYLLYSIKRLSLRHSLGELKFGAKAHSFVTLKRQSSQTMIIRIVLLTKRRRHVYNKPRGRRWQPRGLLYMKCYRIIALALQNGRDYSQ